MTGSPTGPCVSQGGEVLAPGAPDDPIQLIDVRDLGEFLVHLIDGKTTGIFNWRSDLNER